MDEHSEKSGNAIVAHLTTLHQLLALRGDKWHRVGAPNEPGYLNGWADCTLPGPKRNGAEWRRDRDGLVWLRGLIKKDLAPAGGETILTLPLAYRPTRHEIFCCISEDTFGNRQESQIVVENDGRVRWWSGLHTLYVSLSGIVFDGEQ